MLIKIFLKQSFCVENVVCNLVKLVIIIIIIINDLYFFGK